MASSFTGPHKGDYGGRFNYCCTSTNEGINDHKSFDQIWSHPSHVSSWQSPWSLDYSKISLWVYMNSKATHVQEQVLQIDHARWNKHVRFFVHYKGSFGLDCRSKRCYQGWKCGTNSIECFTKILQEFCTRNVHSRNSSKLWSIDL